MRWTMMRSRTETYSPIPRASGAPKRATGETSDVPRRPPNVPEYLRPLPRARSPSPIDGRLSICCRSCRLLVFPDVETSAWRSMRRFPTTSERSRTSPITSESEEPESTDLKNVFFLSQVRSTDACCVLFEADIQISKQINSLSLLAAELAGKES